MTEQKKDYILNNLDKFLIDGKGNFISLDKDYEDNDYIIWKENVNDYEEVKEKVIQEIVRNKNNWGKVNNKEIIEDIMEAILVEKENWEIIYDDWWLKKMVV